MEELILLVETSKPISKYIANVVCLYATRSINITSRQRLKPET